MCRVCLFLQNKDFEARAEFLLTELHAGGAQASAALHNVQQQLHAAGDQLGGLGSTLSVLHDKHDAVAQQVGGGG